MKKCMSITLVLAMFLLPAASFGATATGNFTSYVTIQAGGTCTVIDGGLSFGTVVPPILSNIDYSAVFGVTCPNGTPYTVALAAGNSGNQLSRAMVDPATSAQVAYNVYTDSPYSSIWGDGTSGTALISGTGSGSAQYIFAYSRIPVQPDPLAGTYSDSLTITLTY